MTPTCPVCGKVDSACGHQALTFPPLDFTITGGPEEMAENKEPAVVAPQNVASKYGTAGYRGNHIIAGGTRPTPTSPAVAVASRVQPAPTAGLAARATLVKRAMELGLKGSGTTAELGKAIAAREEWLALEAATKSETEA